MRLRNPDKRVVKTPDDRMTFYEHLAELRSRIIKCALAIVVGAFLVFLFYNPILSFLQGPYGNWCADHAGRCASNGDFIITGPLDGFAIRIKVAGWGGLIVALPVVLWQLWRFITPGLHPKEKRYAIPFVASSIALFAFGALIAWLTLPLALDFLISFSGSTVAPLFTPNSYISLVMLMMVAFGSGFLFPVVIVFLELVGVLTPQQLSKWRRYAIVVIVIVAAVITPSGDPYSMLALAIPMTIFYEISIIIGRLINRSKAKSAARAAASSA